MPGLLAAARVQFGKAGDSRTPTGVLSPQAPLVDPSSRPHPLQGGLQAELKQNQRAVKPEAHCLAAEYAQLLC